MKRSAPVFFVDDGDTDRELFRFAAAEANWRNTIVEFENGEELVRHVERSPGQIPALILIDLKMPRMDGFQLLDWLKTRAEWYHVPKVILTSSDLEQDRVKAMSLGATDFHVKPRSFFELIDLARQFRQRWLEPGPASPTITGNQRKSAV